ncbi:hypothetical protein FJR38_21755 [Anabaena sp. UHCC 0253]|uniref:glycosyl hydrolase family 28 protein n=1 Tax=Anabaena sp. UHCC 0253 TaxID=2590019 RepID=UPI001444D164|nr:glycosyl hydrolase family 28 protein [Anabaena sp. UHCC 0253]MTJ55107.1 hypothetical protein [Anabaena sp. UHCC 0253]
MKIPNQQHSLVKRRHVIYLLTFGGVTLSLIAGNTSPVISQPRILEVYSTPKIAKKSSSYQVTVNGQPIFVHKYNSISYVHFAFAGIADINISYKQPIKSYTLSPKSANISSRHNNNKISFSLQTPRKLILHKINGVSEELYIFADPLENQKPDQSNPNVINLMNYGVDNTGVNDVTDKIQQAIDEVSARKGILYIPPGVYKTQQLNLKSNMTMYLAGGSVLLATKEINPSYGRGVLHLENVSNVKIMGRGLLYGNGSYWRPRGGWYSLIQLVNTNNISVEDILFIDAAVANVWMGYTDNCTFYNVKILANPEPIFANTDGFGFWSSRNITIDNVLYKGTDDATSHGGSKLKSITNNENINVRNSVFYNYYSGGIFKIGTTVEQDVIRNITYENIDVVFAGELSGFWPVTGANFENIYFKNIRVEEIVNQKKGDASSSLFQWRIIQANWEPTSTLNTLGYIRNIYFYNLKVDDIGREPSIFQGHNREINISNINFDNMYVNEKLITNPTDANFELKNQYVDLQFTRSNPTIVEIVAAKLYTSKSEPSGHFRINRTGNISQDLQVKYTIRGTAKNGVDYQKISNSITIPPGKKEVYIDIKPIKTTQQKRISTVILSLENIPNKNDYLIGSNFLAAVNISED